MKGRLTVAVVATVICVVALVWLGTQSRNSSLTVVSVPNNLSDIYLNYLVYVPGDKSVCTWTWEEIDGQHSFTTQENGPNAKHEFMYPKDRSNFFNPDVTCLSDNGHKYQGILP